MKLTGALGGGHGHHEPFEVPHYSTYNNYKRCPQLAAHEERLSRLGLKDPWIRNYVHTFNPDYVQPRYFYHIWTVLKPGFRIGLGLAASMIAVEEAYSYYKHGHTSWAGH